MPDKRAYARVGIAALVFLSYAAPAVAAPRDRAVVAVFNRMLDVTFAPGLIDVNTDAVIDVSPCRRTSPRRAVCGYSLTVWEWRNRPNEFLNERGRVVVARTVHVRPDWPFRDERDPASRAAR